jgi:hypothetical protein
MNQPATIAMDWVPAFGPSTAVLDMETVLSCSLLIWLLARLLPAATNYVCNSLIDSVSVMKTH